MHETRPLIAADPILRAPSPEIEPELNGASAAYKGMAQRKSDARTHRTPKALRAKLIDAPIRFRESFGSAHASSRRFWSFNVLIF
jgi:hypothetical protein